MRPLYQPMPATRMVTVAASRASRPRRVPDVITNVRTVTMTRMAASPNDRSAIATAGGVSASAARVTARRAKTAEQMAARHMRCTGAMAKGNGWGPQFRS